MGRKNSFGNFSSMNNYIITKDTCGEWETIYEIARNDQDHPLWENYQNINLADYDAMIINVRDGIPAAFHGVYNNGRWPDNVARICNRAYINPYFRDQGKGLEITADNIKYVLSLYKLWKKDVLFITRGVQYDNPAISYRKFEKFAKFVSETTGYNLEFDNRLYKCCPSESKDCYQFALWYDPKGIRKSLDIKSIEIPQWEIL
jgi:hypothetical protein